MTLRLEVSATALVCGVLVGTAPSTCFAETRDTVQAILGGAAIGAELLVIGEAAVGLRGDWFYAAGGIVGAAGGGTAGYYLGKMDPHSVPSFLLAGAFALFIPSMIGLASSQFYQPPASDEFELRSDLSAGLSTSPWGVGDSFTAAQQHLFETRQSSEFTIYLFNGVF